MTLFKVIGAAAANPPNEGATLRANRASPNARLGNPGDACHISVDGLAVMSFTACARWRSRDVDFH